MKNVVLLTIDSLSAESMRREKKYGKTVMPFFRKLIANNIYVDKYFSEGPHTEFGLQAMMTGMHTLDNGGSMRRLVYAEKTIYDYFLEANYKVAKIDWPSNYYPKRLYGKIEDYYTQGDSFNEVIYWRLGYCLELYNQGIMQEEDWVDLIGCFTDSFNSYLNFLDVASHNAEAYFLTKNRIANVNFKKRYCDVLREYDVFMLDKRKYVSNILMNQGKLPVVLTEDENASQRESEEIKKKIAQIYHDNKYFFCRMKYKQVLAAICDARTMFRKVIKSLYGFMTRGNHEYTKSLTTRINQYRAFNILKQNRDHIDSSSCKTQLNFVINLLEKNKYSDKPYFIYLHTISQHDPTQWLSYDRHIDEIKNEFYVARSVMDKTKKYHGHYAYRLGQKYIDECLKFFFEKLSAKGLLDDTIVVITADHGSSVCDNPYREEQTFNNCHTELYHIPLLICGTDKSAQRIKGFYTHKDLIPTLLDISKIKNNYSGRGKSIFDETYSPDIALAERTPSGAPSLLHKDIIYTARNNKYLIEYKCSVFEPFKDGVLLHVFDREKDGEELYDLVDKIDVDKIADLLKCIGERHIELCENYKRWRKKDHSKDE